jgi:hypothetical protein
MNWSFGANSSVCSLRDLHKPQFHSPKLLCVSLSFWAGLPLSTRVGNMMALQNDYFFALAELVN